MGQFRDSLEQARLEYETQNREDEEQARRNQDALTRSRFIKMFGVEPDAVDGHRARMDGVDLVNAREGYGWSVMGTCPRCGGSAISTDCYTPAQVGEQLVNFTPDWSHSCPPSEPEETLEHRLLDVLGEFVRSVQANYKE